MADLKGKIKGITTEQQGALNGTLMTILGAAATPTMRG